MGHGLPVRIRHAILDHNPPQDPSPRARRECAELDTTRHPSRGADLHFASDNGNKTAGCIAVKKKVMRDLMTWLDPKKDPVIVIRVT